MLPRYFYTAKAENLYSIGLIRPTLTINFIVLKFACISCYLLVRNRSIKFTIDSIRCNFYNKNKQEINIRRAAAEAQKFAHFLPISEPKLCTQIRCDCVAFFWGGIAAE